MFKPSLFIGSSSESLPVAKVLQKQLASSANVRLWSQGIFGLSNYTLDSLLKASKEFDFAVFVFALDDTVVIRKKRYLCARDNVVLEMGLFAGRLGRHRTFIVMQKTKEPVHLPSDLNGITTATFDWPEREPFSVSRLEPHLGPVSTDIETAILGATELDTPLKSLSGGMVFLALCLANGTQNVRQLVAPFCEFQKISSRLSSGTQSDAYAEKATKYACQCLQAVGMAEASGGDEFNLSILGQQLLKSPSFQERFDGTYRVFQQFNSSRLKR